MTFASVLADWASWFGQLLPGLWVSVEITAAILAVGLPAGLLLALAVAYGTPPLRALALAVVEIGRGVPALVTVYIVYFGLPQEGITLSSFAAGVAAFGFVTAAYSSEIFRGGLNAVAAGQHEAAAALGLTRGKALQLVVVPQAVRLVIPPTLGFAIQVFQGTALLFVIGLPELLSRAYLIGTTTFQYLSVLVLAGLMYALVAWPASRAVRRLEHDR